MIVKRIREKYPLIWVLRLMMSARPLMGVKDVFKFYTAPIRRVASL